MVEVQYVEKSDWKRYLIIFSFLEDCGFGPEEF